MKRWCVRQRVLIYLVNGWTLNRWMGWVQTYSTWRSILKDHFYLGRTKWNPLKYRYLWRESSNSCLISSLEIGLCSLVKPWKMNHSNEWIPISQGALPHVFRKGFCSHQLFLFVMPICRIQTTKEWMFFFSSHFYFFPTLSAWTCVTWDPHPAGRNWPARGTAATRFHQIYIHLCPVGIVKNYVSINEYK